MLGKYRAVKCLFRGNDRNGYYNDITEERLSKIFTIREYK